MQGRRQEIVEVYRKNPVLKAVAGAFGLSQERVAQILEEEGVRERRKHYSRLDFRVQRLLGKSGPLPAPEIARLLGKDPRSVRLSLQRQERRGKVRRVAKTPQSRTARWTHVWSLAE